MGEGISTRFMECVDVHVRGSRWATGGFKVVAKSRSTLSVGLGNHSGECETRTEVDSIGLFLDGGGDADQWAWPAEDIRSPGDDASFGIRWNDTADEYGGAVDGEGETTLHSGGALP